MRIIIAWTGAVLLVLNPVSAKSLSNSFCHVATPAFLANALFAAPADDDAKKTWPRINVAVEEKPFLLDHAGFIASLGQTLVEFYIQVGYDRLSFIRDGKMFRAVYDIDFYIEDEHGNLLQTQTALDEISVTSYDETTRPDKSRVTLLSAGLRPGNYQWRAVITDKENGRNYESASKFSARDFSGPNLTVSDLQFSRQIQVDSSANVFVKNNRRVEPNVQRTYGQFVGLLFVYYEIYNLIAPADSAVLQTAATDSFQTLYIIRHESGKEIKQLWKFIRKPGTSCVQSVALPIADLKSGQYTLTVRVFDSANGCYAESSSRFTMQWDVFSFKDKKFEEVLEPMCYVASADELNQLRQLPEADRQRGLFAFWQRRDPTPGTARNEALEEYYRRLDYANIHFKWPHNEGWKSPQGQIYITYGPPDHMSRFDSAAGDRTDESLRASAWSRQETSPRLTIGRTSMLNTLYEIWEYTGRNRRFVFVDSRNAGVYELADPRALQSLGLR
jgi:GWxTD domain-containing protein